MAGMISATPPGEAHPQHHIYTELRALRAVATVELTKGVISILVAAGLLLLLHRDYWDMADHLLEFLHISEDSRFAQALLDWADRLNDKKILATVGVISVYATLRFVEGYGLWHACVWAEWFALISGSLYVPFEVYQLATHPSIFHVALLVLNLVIVFYMAYLRWTAHAKRKAARSSAGGRAGPG